MDERRAWEQERDKAVEGLDVAIMSGRMADAASWETFIARCDEQMAVASMTAGARIAWLAASATPF